MTHGAKLSKEVKYVPLPDRPTRPTWSTLGKMQEGHRVRRRGRGRRHDRRAAARRELAEACRPAVAATPPAKPRGRFFVHNPDLPTHVGCRPRRFLDDVSSGPEHAARAAPSAHHAASARSRRCCSSRRWSRCSPRSAIVYILVKESVVFFQQVSIVGLPHRHAVDAAVRRRALRHHGAALGHADQFARWRWRSRSRSGTIIAIYLSEFAPFRVREIAKPFLELLGGVPTIVYGYFALLFVTPMLQWFYPELPGFNLLVGRHRHGHHDHSVREFDLARTRCARCR